LDFDSQHPEIRPLAELDAAAIQKLLPEIPLWVKNPDFDRVRIYVLRVSPFLDRSCCLQSLCSIAIWFFICFCEGWLA